MLVEILAVITITLLIVLLIVFGIAVRKLNDLFQQEREHRSKDVELAVSQAWIRSGLIEKVGKLETYAQDVRESHKTLEEMLRVPKERASLGEMVLEDILADQLPPEMFGIRKRVLDGKVPDAFISSMNGIVCIDSKFTLDNYAQMIKTEDSKQSDAYKKRFLRDMRGHLDKIADDYVCPELGSAEFAFAFVPSEAVYWFLINEGYELLREYVKRGVQVVSPLTLSHKIALIRAGVVARKLSEQAGKIRNDIRELSREFSKVDDEWKVLYQTHLRRLDNKAKEVDIAYGNIRNKFGEIAKLGE